MPRVDRYAAFADDAAGGNLAGVVLDASTLSEAQMQAIAADVGYSETAFVATGGDGARSIRYFSPEREVDFCGHATIAVAVAIGAAHGTGEYELRTPVGPVRVQAENGSGRLRGSFLSPAFDAAPMQDDDRVRLLELLGWEPTELHPEYPPAVAFAGNWHPVLVASTTARLAILDYDFDGLRQLCQGRRWTTVQLIAPAGEGVWRSRNPFPWGGVVEDPATGAAAAAFAGYLLRLGHVDSSRLTIVQGVEMGRPSTIDVSIEGDRARIAGSAARIEG